MRNLLLLSLLLPLLTSQNARAERYITWNQIEFEVNDGPSGHAREGMRSSYRLRLRVSRRSLQLTPRRFYILAALFAARPDAVDGEMIRTALSLQGLELGNLEQEIDTINTSARAKLGAPLVMTLPEDGRFKLADPPLYQHERGDVLFAFHESGEGIILQGTFVQLTSVQMKLVRYLFEKGEASFAEIAEALRWRSPRGQSALLHAGEINRRTLRRLGTHLLLVQNGQGLRFDARPAVLLPPPASLRTNRGLLQMTGLQKHVFDTLALWELPRGSQLYVSQKDLLHVGLPLKYLLRALRGVNREFADISGRELLQTVEIELTSSRHEIYQWRNSDFEELTAGRGQLRVVEASSICNRHLNAPTASEQSETPDWYLVN